MPVEKYKSDGNDFFDELERDVKSKDNKQKIYDDLSNKIKNMEEYVKEIQPKLVFLEDSEDVGKVYIGRKRSVQKQYGSKACAFIGKVAEEQCKDKKVYLDGLNPHVVFLDGARGTGKSYLLGVIAEELAKTNQFIGQIVVDPVGVFWSMKFSNKDKKELQLLEEWNIKPEGLSNMKVFVPEGVATKVSKETYDDVFSLYPSLLTVDDWCITFGIDRFSPSGLLLEKTLDYLKKGFTATGTAEVPDRWIEPKGNQFALDDIIFCLQNNVEFSSAQKGYKPDSIRALVSRFDAAKAWGVFSNRGTPLGKLSREGQLTILDTSFLEENITALVIGILARRILSARKLIAREDASGKEDNGEINPEDVLENEIPPTWLYIDEAHTLIPSGNTQTPATDALIEYVKQGRRPGCSLVFATQQPAAINTKVLSQVDILISNKLIFNDDIHAIQKRMPAIIPEPYKHPNFVKTLPFATALVGDRSEETSRAFILKIRPRASQHEGRDVETIRNIPSITQLQAISIVVKMIIKKMEPSKELEINRAKDVLDAVNVKYHKNVLWEEALEKLGTKGIVESEGQLIFGEKAVIVGHEDFTEISENIVSTEQETKEEKVLDQVISTKPRSYNCLPLRISKIDAESIARSCVKNKFLFFRASESIQSISLTYRPIYKIDYNLYNEAGMFVKKTCYIDSVTGEFLHFVNSEFRESKGVSLLSELSEMDLELLYLLEKPKVLSGLAETIDLQESEIARRISFFKENSIVDHIIKKDRHIYKLSKNFDLPFDAGHKILSSLADIPLKKEFVDAVENTKFAISEVYSYLEKLWGDIEFIGLEEVYWPVWHVILVGNGQNKRELLVDGVIGQVLQ